MLEHFNFCHVCDHAGEFNEILASGYKFSHVLSASGISSLPGAAKKKSFTPASASMCTVNYSVCRSVVNVQIPQNSSAEILGYDAQRNCSNEHVINKIS